MYGSFGRADKLNAADFKNFKNMKSLKYFILYTYEFRKNEEALKALRSYVPKGCEAELPE